MRSLVIALTFGTALSLMATSADAQIIFSDDFSSYADGDLLNAANSPWQPKWEPDTDQQDLFSVEGTGADYAVLDTSIATRQYRVNGRTPFTMQSGDTVTISSDIRYLHASGGPIAAPDPLNINFIALQLSDNENWWTGTRKSIPLANRGTAIGNSLPVDPWIENWQPHTTALNVDTTNGGYSDWMRLDWVLTVNGAGNIEGVGTLTNLGTETELFTTTPVDLGYLPGTTLYAGYSTDWNNGGADALGTLAKITEVNVDNFQIDGGQIVAPAGDFDGDGDADGADFLLWQRGTPPDAGQLTDWQGSYGSLSAVSSFSAVPEPTTLALCCLALSVGAGIRRTRS